MTDNGRLDWRRAPREGARERHCNFARPPPPPEVTGTGKTAAVKKAFRSNYYELSSALSGTAWFDGYNGEQVLLVDNFFGGIKYSDLLTILKHGKKKLDVKGSYTWAKRSPTSKHVCCTA